MNLKGNVVSTPIAIIALVILTVVGVYLAFTIKQSNQVIETDQSITSLPSSPSLSSQPSNTSSGSTPDETADWQTYTNDEHGFSFKYPQEWKIEKSSEVQMNDGDIIRLQDPETLQKLENKEIDPSYAFDLVVSYWSDINKEYAKGGSWVGSWQYKDLEDFFTDKNSMKQKIGETTLDQTKAYEVTIGGSGANYGIMVEKDGIYQFSFETAQTKTELSTTQNQILSTFKFTD